MPVLPILRWPDPRLAQVCAPVGPDEDVAGLVSSMFETMYDAPGRGLAAPQVGVVKRVFVMDVTWKEGARSPVACINPEILDASGQLGHAEEACLSIPGIAATIERPAWVRMGWTDLSGTRQEALFEGNWAICAQHEYDHLDGRVIFDRLTPEARAVLETAYEDSKGPDA
ncbi:peptide deformylase [Pseudooceanicola sp. LIPI14-2-Ac024]|uniref:peptide deformylase n=1 Tax=Pseudooceanicola sp. LIPI14-2-Ac024 TaxID=3344875 RepID=UPI0035CFE498